MNRIKILYIIMVSVFIIYPKTTYACFQSVSFSSFSNRSNGHQTQCRVFGSYSGTGDNSCFTYSSGNTSIVKLETSGGKMCFYSVGHGITSINVTVKASCMCDGISVSKSITATLSEHGLKELTVKGYVLSPAFKDGVYAYFTSVPNNVSQIEVDARGNDTRSKITGTGILNLKVGVNTFKVTVKTPEGMSATYTLKVTREEPIRVSSVKLDIHEEQLYIGDKLVLTSTILPSDAANKKVVFLSSDEKVAIVNDDGEVTGIGEGIATITVKTLDGNFEDKATITVSNKIIKVTGVSFNEKTINMKINDTFELKYFIMPEDASNKEVIFESSNSDVVTVNELGVLKAISGGSSTITITSKDGDFLDKCEIMVTIPVNMIVVDNKKITMKIGESNIINASVMPENADNQKLIYISNDPNIACVDQDGNIKAISKGETFVRISTIDGTRSTSVYVSVDSEEIESTKDYTIYVMGAIIVIGIIGGYFVFKKI